MELLYVTLEEAWAIHDNVRQTDKMGQEWDKEFMVLVMEAILSLDGAGASTLAPLLVTEADLWQIDRQVPRMLKVGTEFVGQSLLNKIMALLVKGVTEDARENNYTSENPNKVS